MYENKTRAEYIILLQFCFLGVYKILTSLKISKSIIHYLLVYLWKIMENHNFF